MELLQKKLTNKNTWSLIHDSRLSFDKHLDEKMIKAKKNVGMLKHLAKFLSLKTLDQMYKALVRASATKPTTLRCVIKFPNGESGKNSIPSRSCYYWCMAKVNRSKLYEELCWESLSDRRMCRRVLQIHKIINEKTPSYLKDKLHPNHRPFLVSVFREVICRTNRYSHSFFPDAIVSWNRIITDFEDFPS